MDNSIEDLEILPRPSTHTAIQTLHEPQQTYICEDPTKQLAFCSPTSCFSYTCPHKDVNSSCRDAQVNLLFRKWGFRPQTTPAHESSHINLKMVQMYIHRLVAFLLQKDLYGSTLPRYTKNDEVVLQDHDYRKCYLDRQERSDLLLTNHQAQMSRPSSLPGSIHLRDDGGYVDGGYVNGYDSDGYDPHGYDTELAEDADAWFELFRDKVHPLLDLNTQVSKRANVEPVKIAILDTGLELPELGIHWYEHAPIKDCRSWLEPDKYPDGDTTTGSIDMDGNGTHAAGLILEVARDAELYVGRVFENESEGQNVATVDNVGERIAKAIRYAVETWEVDIITISLGLEEEVESINDAIIEAYKKKVLIIASTSNNGGNFTSAWPATSPLVIAVNAATGIGNKYDRNPSPRSYSDNFSTLGVAVDSWWPEHLNQGERRRCSGTCPAPIAAGIAGTVMAIARQPERISHLSAKDQRKLRRLGTSNGMAAVFRKMVIEKRDGYDFLVPWEFLDSRYSSPLTIIDNILKVL